MNRILTLVVGTGRSTCSTLNKSSLSTVFQSCRYYNTAGSNNGNSNNNKKVEEVDLSNYNYSSNKRNFKSRLTSTVPPAPKRIVSDTVKENEAIVNRLKSFIKKESNTIKIITLLQSYFFDSSVNYHRLVESDELLNFIALEQPQKLTVDMLNMFLQFHCSVSDDYRVQRTCSLFSHFNMFPNMSTHQLALQFFVMRNMAISLERFQRVDIIQFIMESLIRNTYPEAPQDHNTSLQLLANSLSTVSSRMIANLLLLNQCLDGKQDIYSFLSQVLAGKNSQQIESTTRYLIQLYLHLGMYRPALITFLQLRGIHGITPSMSTIRVFYRHHLTLLQESLQQKPSRPKTILRHQLCTLFWFEFSRSFITERKGDTINSPIVNKVEEILDPMVAEILAGSNIAGEPNSDDLHLQQLLSRGMKTNQDDPSSIIKHLQHFNFSQNQIPYGDLIVHAAQTLQTVLTPEKYFTEFLPKVPSMFRDLFMQPIQLQDKLKNNIEYAVREYMTPNEDLSILTESIVTWNGLIIGLLNAHDIELASKVMLSLISKNPKLLRSETLKLYSDYIIENNFDPRQLVDNLEWENLRIDNLKQRLFNCKLSSLVYNNEYHAAMEMFINNEHLRDANTYIVATSIYLGKHQTKRLTFAQFKNELLPALNLPYLSHATYQDYYASIFSTLQQHNLLTPDFVRQYIESENIHFIGLAINQKLLLLILQTLPTPMERIVLLLRCSYPNNNFSKQILDIIMRDCQTVKDKQIDDTIQELIRKQKEREQLELLEQQTTKSVGSTKLSVSELVNLPDSFYDKEFDIYQLTPIKAQTCKISSSSKSFIKRNFIDRNKK